MLIWWGPELTFIYNDDYAPMLGKRHPEALGKNAREVWSEIWPAIGPQVEEVFQRGKASWNECRHLVVERNGFPEDAWFTWSYSPIPDGKGGIGGLFTACTEETSRVQSEQDREELISQRQLALNAANMGWWHFDPVQGIAKWDDRHKAIFGFNHDQLDYKSIMLHIHPEDRDRVDQAVRAALDPLDPKSFSIEYRITRKNDKAERWIAANGLASFTGEGKDRKATSFVGTALDITDRKRAEEAFRSGEARLRLIMTNVKDHAIFTLDTQGRVTSWNVGAERVFGYSTEEIVGQSGDVLFTPEDRMEGVPLRERSLASEAGIADNHRMHVRKDGKNFFTSGSMEALRDENNDLHGFVKVIRDITEQRRIERQQAEMLDAERAARMESERVARMKDEFLATLSHELRTPLNAILGWAQLLQIDTPDETRLKSGLSSIERNSRIQAKLIEDLLDMSRIISGKIRLDIQPVILQDVIREAIESVRPAAEAKSISLQTRLTPVDATVYGDPGRLQQVLWNILSNAVKFTPLQGEILVELKEADRNYVKIKITDTGQGITPEFLPHIFERFRQADATTTRSHGGLGLGLAIVKQLVELHGGKVCAASPGEGQGSSFIIKLPKKANAAEKDINVVPDKYLEEEMEVLDVPDLTGVKILIVDDHEDARQFLQRLLEHSAATVISVSSAVEALILIEREPPDLLVCDISMPGMDGHELIRKVRELPAESGGKMPAIAVTAFARDEDRERALSAGYQAHLPKPVDSSKFLSMAAELTSAR